MPNNELFGASLSIQPRRFLGEDLVKKGVGLGYNYEETKGRARVIITSRLIE